jgi:hypothetical protein
MREHAAVQYSGALRKVPDGAALVFQDLRGAADAAASFRKSMPRVNCPHVRGAAGGAAMREHAAVQYSGAPRKVPDGAALVF